MKESNRLAVLSVIVASMLMCAVAYRCGQLLALAGQTDGHEEPIVELKIDTCWIHDTIRTAGPVVVREEVREVPAAVDTAAILSAYYTERIISDSFHLRDVATVRITDTLFANAIIGRQVDYDLALLQPSVTVSGANTRRPQLALSVGVQIGREQAALMAGFRFKRTEVLGGYDFRLKSPSVTIKYDIKQWQ